MPADRGWPDDALRTGLSELLLYARGNDLVASKLHALLDQLPPGPVVPVPPCPTCGGDGCDSKIVVPRLPCPTCGGSGRDRLIPESEIRATAEDLLPIRTDDAAWDRGYEAAMLDLLDRLDERKAQQ